MSSDLTACLATFFCLHTFNVAMLCYSRIGMNYSFKDNLMIWFGACMCACVFANKKVDLFWIPTRRNTFVVRRRGAFTDNVTDNETLVYQYDQKTKQQSSVWLFPVWILARDQLTSRKKTTDSSVHSHRWNKKIKLTVWPAQPQSALSLFLKRTQPHALLTLCLLVKEVYLYPGADRLSLPVSQRVARGPLTAYTHCSVVETMKRLWNISQHNM